jgi:hypothetical protein
MHDILRSAKNHDFWTLCEQMIRRSYSMKTITVAIAAMFIAAFTFADVPRDAELAKAIVGKWKTTMDYPEAQVKGSGITEYKADGTFSASGEMTVQGKRIRLGAEGVWSVKGVVLTWTVKETINSDLMPVGESHTEEILEIDDKHIKYKGDDGEIEVEARVTEATKEGSSNKIQPAK